MILKDKQAAMKSALAKVMERASNVTASSWLQPQKDFLNEFSLRFTISFPSCVIVQQTTCKQDTKYYFATHCNIWCVYSNTPHSCLLCNDAVLNISRQYVDFMQYYVS